MIKGEGGNKDYSVIKETVIIFENMNLNQFYIPDNSNRILTDKRYKCENETIKFLQ